MSDPTGAKWTLERLCVMILRRRGHWHLLPPNCLPGLVLDAGGRMKEDQPTGVAESGGM